MAKSNSKATKEDDDSTFTRKQVRDLMHEIVNFACDQTQNSISNLALIESDVKLNKDQAATLINITTQSIRDAVFTILASKRM
jgi:hypothetical protein